MTGWHRYWLIWFLLAFTAFLIPEVYCLVKGNGGTLSESVWWLEGWRHGMTDATFDNPWNWTAGHFLFAGVFNTVVVLWLNIHFVLHRMR